jgi:hypothetical protein
MMTIRIYLNADDAYFYDDLPAAKFFSDAFGIMIIA